MRARLQPARDRVCLTRGVIERAACNGHMTSMSLTLFAKLTDVTLYESRKRRPRKS